jgi:hypothetical protein
MAFRNSVKATLLLEPEQPRSRSDEAGPVFAEPAPPPAAAPRSEEESPGALWHARGAALRDMANTLASMGTQSLIEKIAVLYDGIASDAGWRAPDAPSADALASTEEAPPAAPPRAEPHDDGRQEERVTFARRPLPAMRRFARRRG